MEPLFAEGSCACCAVDRAYRAQQEELQRKQERRHAEYVRAKEAGGGAQYAGTDYSEWDLWCPSDEEDELVRGMAPDNAEFSAMEKDIEDRHQSLLRSRRAAERCREGGNAAQASTEVSAQAAAPLAWTAHACRTSTRLWRAQEWCAAHAGAVS